MYPRFFILSVYLLGLIAGGEAKPQYALSVPVLLKSGENANACLNLLNVSDPAGVKVNLEYNGVNTSIFNEIFSKDSFKCKSFQVPTVETSVPVFITLVATGKNFLIVERRSVVIDKMNNITLIQLDKPVYKPGQKVAFRLISLNPQLKSLTEMYTTIYVSDPYGSRMSQWLNKISDRGVVALDFTLLNDATLGTYTIMAEKKSGDVISQMFEVQEYVLPRYSVTLDSPNSISILDRTITIGVSATYTFGQGVPGQVNGRLCRQYTTYYPGNTCNRNPDGLCIYIKGKMGSDGTFKETFDLHQFQLDRSGYLMTLNLEITVTEEGTGVQVKESQSVSVTSEIARVIFDDQVMQQFYRPGIPYFVEMTLQNSLGNPMKNEVIELRVDGKGLRNLTTDGAGKAKYGINTSGYNKSELQIQAVYKNVETCFDSNWIIPTYSNADYTTTLFYSRTGSYVYIVPGQQELSCGKKSSIKVYYSLTAKGLAASVTKTSFYYLVMSKAKIIKFGEQSVDIKSSLQGDFTLSLDVTSEFAPLADVIVYNILPSEVIADTAQFNVEKCFKNQVSLSFSAPQGAPGSNVNLKLKADSKSLCGLRVIDSSLLLLGQYEPFTVDAVYDALRIFSLNGYFEAGFNAEPEMPPCIDPNQRIFLDGLYYQPVSFPGEGNTYNEFKSVGLVFASNTSVYKPEVCGGIPPFVRLGRLSPFSADAFAGMNNPVLFSMAAPASAPVTTVRKFFPEVWKFNLATLDNSGSLTLTEKVPDTITQWQGSMFCISDGNGFGMTRYPSNFTSILPFFVELSLPYSFTRGETLLLRAFVPNYLDKCVKVRVTLKASPDYNAVLQEGTNDICVCPKQRASYSWNVQAKSLGVITFSITAQTSYIGATCQGPPDTTQPPRSDTVIRTVIVEAEGIQKEITYSNLVCVDDSSSSIPLLIAPPNNTVPGSAQGSVIVIGDLLGHAVDDPASLIQLPTGCGEQNLVKLMPIPFVLEYLNCTNQLTKEIQDKAMQYIATGYVRQLGFKRWDGTFSAFGQSDREGSSWLTALTFYTFEKIKSITFVDPDVQNQALIALQRMQDSQTGCFRATGNLFHGDLKGGADNEISFTAYVAILLSESNYPAAPTLLRGALSCLDAASRRDQSLYNIALMFNAFGVSGNLERRNAMLAQLKSKAIQQDGAIHWERPDKPKAEYYPFFFAPSPSAEIEMTAYVLLGMTRGPTPSQDDLSYMAQIALWLARQQNSRGGYRSTADTVVALQALAKYSCLVYKADTSITIKVTSQNTEIAQFKVQPDNRLLVQKKPLPRVPGDYRLDVSGKGCSLIQSSVQYNIPVQKQDSAFSVSVKIPPGSCTGGVAYTIPINITVSYQGLHNQSNMAIVDLKLLSGYTVDYQSLVQLRQKVSKAEQVNNRLVMYLESVSRNPVSLSVTLEMSNRVQNFQPQFVYVYDYYEADENGVSVIKHPCSK